MGKIRPARSYYHLKQQIMGPELGHDSWINKVDICNNICMAFLMKFGNWLYVK